MYDTGHTDIPKHRCGNVIRSIYSSTETLQDLHLFSIRMKRKKTN